MSNQPTPDVVPAMQEEIAALRRDVTRLEDVHAVRTLHFKYGYFIDQCRYDEAVESLVPEMPRSCWEGGIHANTYVTEDGVWKIKVLDYNMLWQADHAKGWGASSVRPELSA